MTAWKSEVNDVLTLYGSTLENVAMALDVSQVHMMSPTNHDSGMPHIRSIRAKPTR